MSGIYASGMFYAEMSKLILGVKGERELNVLLQFLTQSSSTLSKMVCLLLAADFSAWSILQSDYIFLEETVFLFLVATYKSALNHILNLLFNFCCSVSAFLPINDPVALRAQLHTY